MVRTRAFGMDVEADFAMPGVIASAHAGDGRSLSLRLASQQEVERGIGAGVERIAELRFENGDLAVSVDCGSDGYMVHAFDFGHASLAPDGTEGLIAPLELPDWEWQRYLTGQVLPLAALLQGYEVFHASVLGLAGGAIAVVAQSGAGKTTSALRLALKGLDFLSDDVLTLEPTDAGTLAHPGIGLANVRPGAADLLGELEDSGLAAPIGSGERETRISVRRSNEALPLTHLFVLNRYADRRELQIEHLSPVDPRMLLASTFNFAVRTPERMTRQLDICARIAESAPVFRVSCGGGVGAEEVADAILERAGVGPRVP